MELFFNVVNTMFKKGFVTPEWIADNIDLFLCKVTAFLNMDTSTSVRLMVHYGLYCKTIKNLGTEKHRAALLSGCAAKELGCYGLTELGHGSNVRGIETTATYDPESKEFILNSPTKLSMKFWIGNLAKVCQVGIFFAQLITKGVNYGVHAFLLRVRDPNDHLPYPGITVGDCGEKMGLNGIDNGWCRFDHYRVPKDALLDKIS